MNPINKTIKSEYFHDSYGVYMYIYQDVYLWHVALILIHGSRKCCPVTKRQTRFENFETFNLHKILQIC